jgi:hypothetical protein
MREVGLDPNTGGGKRSDAKRLREQMWRLFAARISFQQSVEANGHHGERWPNMEVAPEGELWWDLKEPEQAALWESWIELGEKFYQAIIAAPVPADMRALRALRRSPLALDLYAWATYRVFQVNRKGAAFIPWSRLQEQMGTKYGETRNFVQKANRRTSPFRPDQDTPALLPTRLPAKGRDDAAGGIDQRLALCRRQHAQND